MSDNRETVERVAAWRIDVANGIEGAGNAAAFDVPVLLREDATLLRALLARAEAAERERDEAREIAKHLRVTKLVPLPLPPQPFPWEAHP